MFNLKSNKGFTTQVFDFEEVPVVRVMLHKANDWMSAIYYVDLRK